MKITNKIINKLKGKEGRKREEEIYAIVHNEIERGIKKKGLWVKAIAESEDHKSKAKALYIQFRFQSILDEIETAEERLNEAEELRIEAAEAREQKKIEAAEAREQKKIDKIRAEAREGKGTTLEKIVFYLIIFILCSVLAIALVQYFDKILG